MSDQIGRLTTAAAHLPHPESPRSGLTLEDYSRVTGLPIDFLNTLGLKSTTRRGAKVVAAPYADSKDKAFCTAAAPGSAA